LQVGELGQLVEKVLVFLQPGFQMGCDVLRRSKGRPNGDKAPSGWLAIAAPNRGPQVSQVGRGCLRQRPIHYTNPKFSKQDYATNNFEIEDTV
jgi:hypothetical protein